jgi:hypothetical protein
MLSDKKGLDQRRLYIIKGKGVAYKEYTCVHLKT